MSGALVGLWRLESMEQRYDDGRVVYPFGQDAEGYIFYAADGFMSVAFQKAGRGPFQTGGQWTASDAEKARAYDSVLTYCGRYAVEGDRVVHAIEMSLFPNWIGDRQVRQFTLDGDSLTIRARIEPDTPQARASLMIFRRA
jgi:hypothetical protein